MKEERRDFESRDTAAIHAGDPRPRIDGAIVLPIFQTAMYEYRDASGGEELRYARYGNSPNHRAVGERIAALEGAEAGLVAASGMAVITTTVLALVRPGDHVLAQPGLYGGTHTFFTREARRLDVEVEFLQGEGPEAWSRQLRPETVALYAETVTNPTLEVADLEAMAAFAGDHGLHALIDNTFATPVNFRPLAHGFDLVLHSATKYLNGHSDLVAGAVVGPEELVGRVESSMKVYGAALDPHACFLLERGLKTLPLRMRRHNESALELARALEASPRVTRVNYPGLASHPHHDRARRLLDGYGGMLSFELAGGREEADRVMDGLTIPAVAPSLGGVDSLITRPAATSHRGMDREERGALGITDGLLRVSVGIEDPAELREDFRRALDRA